MPFINLSILNNQLMCFFIRLWFIFIFKSSFRPLTIQLLKLHIELNMNYIYIYINYLNHSEMERFWANKNIYLLKNCRFVVFLFKPFSYSCY